MIKIKLLRRDRAEGIKNRTMRGFLIMGMLEVIPDFKKSSFGMLKANSYFIEPLRGNHLSAGGGGNGGFLKI